MSQSRSAARCMERSARHARSHAAPAFISSASAARNCAKRSSALASPRLRLPLSGIAVEGGATGVAGAGWPYPELGGPAGPSDSSPLFGASPSGDSWNVAGAEAGGGAPPHASGTRPSARQTASCRVAFDACGRERCMMRVYHVLSVVAHGCGTTESGEDAERGWRRRDGLLVPSKPGVPGVRRTLVNLSDDKVTNEGGVVRPAAHATGVCPRIPL